MASSSTLAFGQYLRTLRERRGLSLDDVATLSRTFADPVEKGYLSRCENGHQSLALSKMIALSRIYEVPAEVLVERLELDLEVEKLGSCEVSELPFKELIDRGVTAIRRGTRWEAYRCFRDAVQFADGAVIEGFRDSTEQQLCAWMNVSTAAAGLGRNALALFELRHIQSVGGLSAEYEPLLHDKLSRLYRARGEFSRALESADLAVSLAKQVNCSRYLGYTLGTRARLVADANKLDEALSYYQQAFDAYTAAGRESERATTLLCIGDLYARLQRPSAARRALAAAQDIAERLGQHRTLAHIQLTLGDLIAASGQLAVATAHWRNGLRVAHELRDHGLKFRAEFRLFKHALDNQDTAVAEPLARRLRRMVPWVPPDTEELLEFRRLYHPPRAKARSVARRQPKAV